ncbi:MAG: LysM peptidoglycan-binding domain-containing protein [Anaerolineae bacterium]|nr:LysM peptidoglycan-binding domain-containing protein [Anaerolineae bacterium]
MKARQYRFIGMMMLALLSALWLCLSPIPQATVAQTGANLLVNGDFEQSTGGAWPFQDGIAEVQVGPGWRAYWLDEAPSYVTPSSACAGQPSSCYWARPEFRDVKRIEYDYRVHGGEYAQKYFTFGRQHEAGLYQTVGGITPGTRLRFQIYIQTWSCLAEGGAWNHCPTSPLSNQPGPMHTKVGIDPTGGTNPWAATVVWSGEFETYDVWTPFWVEAVAEAESVTVFTYSRADWPDTWTRLNNDVYIDDATLVPVGDPEPTAAPPPPTPEFAPTPQATSTPRSDGAVVHIVQSGDTLFGIALQYGVDVDELRRLNANTLGPNDLLSVGAELVISGSPMTPAATPESTTAAPEPITPTLVATAEAVAAAPVAPESDRAALCVLAFNDSNADMVHQTESEGLAPNITFSLIGTNGPAGTYTTDGISEPYCFQNLEPGNYVLRQTPPLGYVPSGPPEWGILLGAGQAQSLKLGYTWDTTTVLAAESGDAVAGETVAAESVESVEATAEAPKPPGSVVNTIIKISGIVALVLALAVAGLFVVSRRRAAV